MANKILVIDDEDGIRFSFKRFLNAEGHEVVTAETYARAIDLLNTNRFDLVFTDIVLDNKTGIDILKEIRKRKLRCEVVVFTGVPTIENASAAVKLGAFDYLEKPVRQETLLNTAKAALYRKMKLDAEERQRTHLELVFKSAKDAIVTVDPNLLIVEVNRSVEEICRISRNSVIGKPLMSVTSRCSGKCLDVFEKSLKEKRTVEERLVECRIKHRPEQRVMITATPLLEGVSKISGGFLVIRDKTSVSTDNAPLHDGGQYYQIVGKSEDMQGIYMRIKTLANVQSTVLITGESGTGKELVAEAIHFTGSRRNKPLVKVNCAALTENLLESELFGHVAGAFTGAVKDKIGRFQKADGGTIFLDEITEMPKSMQPSLLRILQEMEFERLGDSNTIRVDVRVLAATNRDIKKEVASGRFRQDLYYRLKVIGIALPALRNRQEDVVLLLDHFIKSYNKMFSRNITGVSDEVMQIFMNHSWPGNIRELKHAIEHAFILCSNHTILPEHLPDDLYQSVLSKKENGECRELIDILEKCRWNKTKTADALGISRQSLYRKMKKYNMFD